ncbi:Thioredoxin reductase [Cytospora mali]|uniref:Thioredoxin reductase n=1 Tax=Cytospora mali TaxID=578113 RepID=A0A194W8I0_CYTMA|nr:Thioredoxin reductase [Valsa mali]
MSSKAKVVDVLIIGGGPAGLTVASTIVRQLQTGILFDAGAYRNARTEHMHGVPGFDHADPETFRMKAKGDVLRRYDTIEFKKAYVEEVKKLDNGNFQVTDGWLNVYEGRKVVLATGVRDIMPQIEGYEYAWGRGIFHCLFCHGYESKGGESAGLFAFDMFGGTSTVPRVGNMVLQLSKNLRIYTNGKGDIASESEASSWRPDFKSRVTIEKRPIRSIRMVAWGQSEVLVTLEDGTQFKESYITHHPPIELNGPWVEQLGLETGPEGEIKVNPPFNETSLPGVFAAGDAASQMRMVPNAIYGGSVAGSGLVAQLQAENAQAI